MISIIVCSRFQSIPSELDRNISESIGVEYELIVIDNSNNKYDIFTAYNEGALRANGGILCFLHDDVLFRTQNWGILIQDYFEKDKKLGLVGFAGAHFLPDTPLYWDKSPFISEHNLTTRGDKTEECFRINLFGNNSLKEVIVVDGMCLFIRKSIWGSVSFDESTYQGFHLYDMDISMQIYNAGYKVCVCKDILVEHFYSFNKNKPGYKLFETNLNKFYNKWASLFPIAVGLNCLQEGFLEQMNSYVKNTIRVEKLYQSTLNSKALRLGRVLLNPIKKFRKNK